MLPFPYWLSPFPLIIIISYQPPPTTTTTNTHNKQIPSLTSKKPEVEKQETHQRDPIMIKALNPYSSSSSKTDEIMSRYRPIAPKPETPPANGSGGIGGAADGSLGLPSPKMNQSPYLRGIWAHLQARPTRARKKRARAGFPHPPALATKRRRPSSSNSFLGFGTNTAAAHQSLISMHMHAGFAHAVLPALTASGGAAVTVMVRPVAAAASIGSHPLLSCPMPSPTVNQPPLTELNFVKTLENGKDISVDHQEVHLDTKSASGGLQDQNDLQLELKLVPSNITGSVISPRPIRPIGSSIRVGFIDMDLEQQLHAGLVLVEEERRRPEEMEEEMEAEELPAIISDSNNKVRMANSAYKEMVGQPECPWLDSMVSDKFCDSGSGRRRRISGEVVIQDVSDTGLPVWAKGFSCWVRIEWESKGEKRWINAFSEVMRLWCDSKDYLFRWRFHVQETEPSALELAPSTSNRCPPLCLFLVPS